MQRIVRLITAVIATVLTVLCVACNSVAYTDKYYGVFTDLYMTVSYYGGNDSGAKELADMLDSEINPDIPTSYVARFNAMSSGEIEVSKHVYELVKTSKQLYSLSGGAFDITLSELSELWCVDHKSLEEYYPDSFPSLPSYSDIVKIESTMDAISVRSENGIYYLSKTQDNARIDLGGIAKGYLSDLVDEKLRANGVRSALVDVSGNLCIVGKRFNENGSESEWKIGVNNCFSDGGSYLCGLKSNGDESVITSGTYERRYVKDGVEVNHILNPHTKMPVGVKHENGSYVNTLDHVISVTVAGKNGAVCDAVATAVCVMGIEDGKTLINELGLSALIVTADGRYAKAGSLEFMQGNFYLDELEEIR